MKTQYKLSLGLIALGISSCATFHWNGERPDLGIQFANATTKINKFKILNDKIDSLETKLNTLLDVINTNNKEKRVLRQAMNNKRICGEACVKSTQEEQKDYSEAHEAISYDYWDSPLGKCVKPCDDKYDVNIPIEYRVNEC